MAKLPASNTVPHFFKSRRCQPVIRLRHITDSPLTRTPGDLVTRPSTSVQSCRRPPDPAAVRVKLHYVTDDLLLHRESVRLSALDAECEGRTRELEWLYFRILFANLQEERNMQFVSLRRNSYGQSATLGRVNVLTSIADCVSGLARFRGR